MPDLAAFQEAFLSAISGDDAALAPYLTDTEAPGLAVYRNTGVKALIDVLIANYPATTRLVGAEFLAAVGFDYIQQHPPRDGRLSGYGEGFAALLTPYALAADLPYLPHVAQLDRLWTESHLAADAPVLPLADLSAVAPDRLAASGLALHPATRFAAFDTPAVEIYHLNRQAAEPSAEALSAIVWNDSAALVVRPQQTVQVLAIPEVQFALLTALAGGADLEQALRAAEARPDALTLLVAAGAFSHLIPPKDLIR